VYFKFLISVVSSYVCNTQKSHVILYYLDTFSFLRLYIRQMIEIISSLCLCSSSMILAPI
jgi:hypothetical protein